MARATPRRPKRRSDETAIHETVEAFLSRAWPAHLPYTHFPAGEARDHVTRTRKDGTEYRFSPAGAKLKRMGLKDGWPDLQFILPNGQAAFIELKSDDGDLSEPQIEVRRKLVALKCGYAVARSVEDVEETLNRWLALFGLKLRATTGVRPPAPASLELVAR